MEGVVDEVNQMLSAAGHLTVDELCIRFGLSSELLMETLHDRVNGVVERGMLFTQQYVSRHTARVRGALSAVSRYLFAMKLL